MFLCFFKQKTAYDMRMSDWSSDVCSSDLFQGGQGEMLTPKQQELLSFIQTRLEEGGVSPSFEEMKEALDLRSKSGIHRLINALEERGFIRRLPNRARALEVLKLPDAMHRAPKLVVPAKAPLTSGTEIGRA